MVSFNICFLSVTSIHSQLWHELLRSFFGAYQVGPVTQRCPSTDILRPSLRSSQVNFETAVISLNLLAHHSFCVTQVSLLSTEVQDAFPGCEPSCCQPLPLRPDAHLGSTDVSPCTSSLAGGLERCMALWYRQPA